MKPPEILALLEEASGTKMYEKKKQASLRTLEKKQTKLLEIDQVGARTGCLAERLAWQQGGRHDHMSVQQHAVKGRTTYQRKAKRTKPQGRGRLLGNMTT